MDTYVTREVTLDMMDFEEILEGEAYEAFLDKLSELHSNTIMLMDITWEQVSPLVLRVTGDVSDALEDENYT
jgi:hypothetical protein